MHLRPLLAVLPILAASAFLSAGSAIAADYYVAPLGAVQSCTPDGTQACPFTSIDAAFASKKIIGGDRVLLLDGDHGGVERLKEAFDKPVVIQSANGNNAHLFYITFDSTAKNITLRSLKVWRADSDPIIDWLIRAKSGSSYITLENLDIRSRADSINYLSWGADRWLAVGTPGITLSSSFNTVRNNTLTGVSTGLSVGTDSLVENNVIDGFSQDGMNGVSRSTFRGNLVKNMVDTSIGYHNDGFQSFSSGDPITDLVIENNKIIQWANDPSHPLQGGLMGISLFDGWYDNLLIRNNLVVNDHTNGISVYGARGAKILNNTVVNLSGQPGTSPSIKEADKKDGSPSQNMLVANNVAMAITVAPDAINNIVALNNSVILDPATAFADIKSFDYRPTAASGFIDTGDLANAPPGDIVAAARPYGAGPDRGAYEVGASTATSGGTDGSTSGGTTTGGSTGGGTTVGNGTVKGWVAKFLKAPKKP